MRTIRSRRSAPGSTSGGRRRLGAAARVLRGGLLRRPRDLLRWFIFALVVMTISRIHAHFPILAAARPGLLLVAGVIALLVIRQESLTKAPGIRTWFAAVLLALAAAACLSAPFGISFGGAARSFLDVYSKVLLLAFFLLVAIRSVDDLWFFVWAYLVGCLLLIYLAFFVFHLTLASDSDIMRLQNLYTYDGNDVCVVLLIGLPLALLAYRVARSPLAKAVAAVVLLGGAGVVAKTGSRGGFLGLAAVGVVLLFAGAGIRLSRRVAFVFVAGAALFLAAPAGYWRQMETVLRPAEDYNWSTEYGRRETWGRGIGYMLQYPFFGVGLLNFPRAEGTISEKARTAMAGTSLRWRSAHSSFVQIGSELGVTGLALFSMLVFGGVVAMVRVRHRMPAEWGRGPPRERFLFLAPVCFGTAMLGFAVSGAFVSHAYKDHFYILVALMSALYGLAGSRDLSAARRVRTRRTAHRESRVKTVVSRTIGYDGPTPPSFGMDGEARGWS